MRKCFLASLFGLILFSCSKPAIRINLDEFNGSYEKAFDSQFQIKDDRIYLANTTSAFDGKLSFAELDKSVKEMTINNGEIEEFVMHDMFNRLIAEGKRDGTGFHIQRKLKTYDSTFTHGEYTLTHFSNKAFVTKPLEEQEGSGVTKGKKGIEGTVKVNINHRKNLIVTEIATKKHGAFLEKSISYVKHLSDSSTIVVTFAEYTHERDYTDYKLFLNTIHEVYVESVIVRNTRGSLKIKTSWSDEGDLRVVSEQDTYNNKNCGVSEVLVSVVSPLAMGESDCVSDGLRFMNKVLKKQITRETLIARFLAKQINNRFLTQHSSDVDFYF